MKLTLADTPARLVRHWSTWLSVALAVLSAAQADLLPLVQPLVPPQRWPWVSGGLALAIIVAKAIKQQLPDPPTSPAPPPRWAAMKAAWWLGPLVAVLLAVAGALGVQAWKASVHAAGYAAGVLDERAIWKAHQELDRLAQQKRQAQDQRKADELLAAGRAEAVAAQDFAARMQMELRRVRSHLVVSGCSAAPGRGAAPAGPLAAAGGGLGAEPGAGDAAAAGAAASGGSGPPGGAPIQADLRADADPVLSAAAVRLWDSATAGRDVPAGACGPAGQPAAACAAATGYTLEDAWANHAANAASCRADRAKHQRLIDFVLSRQGVPGSAP